MVILALAFVPFGGFGWDEPGASFQIDVTPLELEQLADAAEGAQAYPDGALHEWVDRADAVVFLAGWGGVIVAFEAGEDVA